MSFGGAVDFDFGAPRALLETYRRLKTESLAAKPRKPRDDLNDVVARFYSGQWPTPQRKRRDYRLLPWTLAYGAPALYSSPELRRLLNEISLKPRPSQILGMIDSYLQLTSEQVVFNGVQIRAWLASCVRSFEGRNPRVNAWKDYLELLADPRSTGIATEWLAAPDLEEWLRAKPFPVSSHLTQSLLEVCSELVGSQQYRRCDAFLGLIEQVVKPPLAELTRCFDILLTTLATHNAHEPNSNLINYALTHFGDPHLDSRQRWAFFKAEGRQMMAQWISAEDLRLFFDEISGDYAGQERKAFWRAYLDEGFVTYSKIILCNEDRARASSSLKKHLATGRHGVVRDLPASAFVVKIGHLYFLEFSGANNACYVYRADSFKSSFFASTSYYKHELKNRGTAAHWLSHTPGWQGKFDELIATQTGLKVTRKSRSYRTPAPAPANYTAPANNTASASHTATSHLEERLQRAREMQRAVLATASLRSGESLDTAFARQCAAVLDFLAGSRRDGATMVAGKELFRRLFSSSFDLDTYLDLSMSRDVEVLSKRSLPLREYLCVKLGELRSGDAQRAGGRLGLNLVRLKAVLDGDTSPRAILGVTSYMTKGQVASEYHDLKLAYQQDDFPPGLSLPLRDFVADRLAKFARAYEQIPG